METMFTRIKNKRLELKMSQEDLAAKVGYSDKSAISHLEKGELDLPQSKIVAIADALHTTPSYLMDGYDVEAIYKQIQSMDDFDRMVLINRLNKDFTHKRSLLELMAEEHAGSYVTIDEVSDIIADAIEKSEKRRAKKEAKVSARLRPEQA